MVHRFALLLLLGSTASFAQSTQAGQPATYVVGNVGDLSPGDTGSLRLLANQLIFRTGKATIPVPYRMVTELEMGPVVNKGSDEPFWKLHKKLGPKTAYRTLTINFKGEGDDMQTFTVELPEFAAAEAYETVEIRSGLRRGEGPASAWWGDTVWRTARNKQDWEDDKK